ncbi:MAG TPA: phosphotransferase [Candidatus Saccharimonadales bacterium]
MQEYSAGIELATETVRAYGLVKAGEDVSVSQVGTGYVNRVFKAVASDGRCYAVRLPDRLTEESLENEDAIIKQLSTSNLRTATLLRNKNGIFYKNGRGETATVSLWLSGQHPLHNVNAPLCSALGKALATFHVVVRELPHLNSGQLLSPDAKGWLEANLQISGSIVEKLRQRALNFDSKNLPVGIVHGDFHANNILIDAQTIAILDFERAGQSVLLLDIARAVADLCSTADGGFDDSRLAAFLSGYESIRALTYAEYNMLGLAIIYAALAVANWFHIQEEKIWAGHFLDVGWSVYRSPALALSPRKE